MTSAIATSGIIANITGTIEAAVLNSLTGRPGAVTCTNGPATSQARSTNAAPTITMTAITIEMSRSVDRSPRCVSDVRNAGTSA